MSLINKTNQIRECVAARLSTSLSSKDPDDLSRQI